MEKIGKTEGTHDASFDEQQKALEKEHRAIEKLNKDLTRYFELLQEFSVVQSEISNGFAKIYDSQSMPLYGVVHNYGEVVKSMDQTRAKTEEVLKENLILPTVKYLAQFKDVHDRLKEHETRRIDMDRYSRDVKSHQGNPSKLQTSEQKLEAAKRNYNNLHHELSHDIQALQHDKGVYFIYALATYVVASNAYFTDCANQTNHLIDPVMNVNRSDIHTRDPVITPQDLSASFGVGKNVMGFSGESASQKGRPSGMQPVVVPETYVPPPQATPQQYQQPPPQQTPQQQSFEYPPPQKPLPVPVKKNAQ